jgi:hypothetical protein
MALSTLADAGPAAWPFPYVRLTGGKFYFNSAGGRKRPCSCCWVNLTTASARILRGAYPALYPHAEIEQISNLRTLSDAGNADPFCNQAASFYFSISVKSCA